MLVWEPRGHQTSKTKQKHLNAKEFSLKAHFVFETYAEMGQENPNRLIKTSRSDFMKAVLSDLFC